MFEQYCTILVIHGKLMSLYLHSNCDQTSVNISDGNAHGEQIWLFASHCPHICKNQIFQLLY